MTHGRLAAHAVTGWPASTGMTNGTFECGFGGELLRHPVENNFVLLPLPGEEATDL